MDGEADADAEDPYAPAHVAPVVAWLLSDVARAVTGRVLEVGGDRISVAEGWRPGSQAELSRGATVAEIDPLIEQLLDQAPATQPIQRPDLALLVDQR